MNYRLTPIMLCAWFKCDQPATHYVYDDLGMSHGAFCPEHAEEVREKMTEIAARGAQTK